MSKLDKDTVIENFTAAYTKANGKAPSIEAKGGWYSVDGGKNVRLAQLDEMTSELSGSSPAKAATPAAKATTAKKATDKAPAKKAAPKKKATKASTGFSVKDFYTKQIQEVNPGAKAPR
ncbi:MAG: hypothetical protein WA981_04405 [Glaciecola sp.]